MEKHEVDEETERSTDSDKSARDFRSLLDQLERKSQEAYDKAILTLSGGALGVTISFVKDVVPTETPTSPGLLLAS